MRTHTSPVQARTMENAMDKDQLKLFVLVKFIAVIQMMRHIVTSSQIEGLVVDKNIKMSDLKGTLELVAKNYSVQTVKFDYVLVTSRSLNLL